MQLNLSDVMNRRGISISILATLFLLGADKVSSQDSTDTAFAAFASDSTAWQQVLRYTVSALSPQIVASASDPTAQPWRLQLPDDPEEELIRTQLRTLLRARQVMPADTLVRTLTIGPLVIQNDTARVNVHFEETRKCLGTGRSTGFGWTTTVLVPRVTEQKIWGAAFSRSTLVGDRVPC